jgi:glycosyltransferase involved in cell wall biosynthesis
VNTVRSPLQGHIVAVGRLSAEKGFITLLNAFAVLAREPNCRLTIVGEGAQRPELEALIRQLGLSDRVSLNGHSSNPLRILATAELFVSASTHEGFGNAIIEAMARGVPIVATDAPHGPREILEEGRYGTLVPVGDISALAGAMKAMLESPAESRLLEQRATAFSVEAATDTFIDALDRAGLALAPADRRQLDLKSGR